MKKNVLLIGGTGFAGRHMQQLLSSDCNVIATGRSIDICDIEKLKKLVKDSAPDFVVNFASITTVKESFENPHKTYEIGFFGTLNLLNSLNESGFKGRLLNISSSEVYGHYLEQYLPISENVPLLPMSPYAVSKVAVEALCYQWSRNCMFDVLTARPFTHIGSGQSERFSVSNFCMQIAQIIHGLKPPVLFVGDLDTTRDFTDVRDTVRAYQLLLANGVSGESYNICSGKEVKLSFLLSELIRLSGIDIEIKRNVDLIRQSEQKRVLGDLSKIKREIEWQPVITLDETLADMLEYQLKKLAREVS